MGFPFQGAVKKPFEGESGAFARFRILAVIPAKARIHFDFSPGGAATASLLRKACMLYPGGGNDGAWPVPSADENGFRLKAGMTTVVDSDQ